MFLKCYVDYYQTYTIGPHSNSRLTILKHNSLQLRVKAHDNYTYCSCFSTNRKKLFGEGRVDVVNSGRTIKFQLFLPGSCPKKIKVRIRYSLQELIQSWRTRRWCNRCQLESLIGHLHHAAKVVWPGRMFVRHMLDLLCCFRTRDHPIHLSSKFWLDL